MDSESVIYLGHTLNVPLIRVPSELSYGLEPHGPFDHDLGPDHDRAVRCGVQGVYPGWGAVGGYLGG